jgi:sodium-coupled neutral amino acid transporter 11
MKEAQPLLGSINQAIPVASSGGNAGLFSSIVNLTNTILGAGLLAIPFAFRLSGVGLGLIFLTFVWMASALSFDVLARAAHLTGLFTYKEIAMRAWGKPLALISELCILLYTFLNLVARPIILSEYLVTVFSSWIDSGPPILGERWFFIIIVSLIIYPLTFLRNIDALKYSSFFSLVCVLFTAIVVVIMFGKTPDLAVKAAEMHFWPDSVSALISLGIMVVSFCAHYNAPRMYQELEARSISKMRVVIVVSSGMCFLAYAVVGVTGYMT